MRQLARGRVWDCHTLHTLGERQHSPRRFFTYPLPPSCCAARSPLARPAGGDQPVTSCTPPLTAYGSWAGHPIASQIGGSPDRSRLCAFEGAKVGPMSTRQHPAWLVPMSDRAFELLLEQHALPAPDPRPWPRSWRWCPACARLMPVTRVEWRQEARACRLLRILRSNSDRPGRFLDGGTDLRARVQ
jgi:hypothetical protein